MTVPTTKEYRYCKICGTKLDSKAKFCKKCGTKVSNVSKKITKDSEKTKVSETFKQTYGMPPSEYDKLINGNKTKPKEKDTTTKPKHTEEPFRQTFGMTDNEYNSRIKSSEKKKFFHTSFFKYSLIVFTIILFYSFSFVSDYASVFISENSATTEIRDIANNSGLNVHGKALFYQSSPELVTADLLNQKCPNDTKSAIEFGCYLPKENKIYILRAPSSDIKEFVYTTAAHETLHVAWYKMPDGDKSKTIKLLKEAYNDSSTSTSKELHELLEPYGTDDYTIDSELHSFFGSEVGSTTKADEIEAYYHKYFDNRALSINAQVEFENSMKKQNNALVAQNSKLDRIYSEINNYKAVYLDRIEGYLASNRYYGDVDTYNKNVDAYNNNLKIYKNKVADYQKQVDKFNEDVNTYNNTIKQFYPSQIPLPTK